MVQRFQLGTAQHHRGVDPHCIRPQSGEFPGGFHGPLGAVPVEAQHHLKAQLQPSFPDEPGGIPHRLGIVAPPVHLQDPVVHALGPQLHSGDPIAFQHREDVPVDGVRPGGKADTPKALRPHKGKCRLQQLPLVSRVDGGETAAKKGNFRLPGSLPQLPESLFTGRLHLLGGGGRHGPGNFPLVAEAALVWASQMGDKDGYIGVFPHHCPINSKASLAAICSASFLLLPTPWPMTLELRRTSTSNRLLWSGPDSSTST